MYKILEKKILNKDVTKMIIDAPLVAKRCEAGQFIILRAKDDSERIPLTINDYDRKKGTISIVFQVVGEATIELNKLCEGDCIETFVGPLGKKTDFDGAKKAIVIGGGLGSAIAYPLAKAMKEKGIDVTSICGFRNKDLIILEDEFKKVSNKLIITTDDGSNGIKGFVTDRLEELLKVSADYDAVYVIGPLIMMKFVSLLTLKYNLKTIVSMNPLMVDGTGMCGGCRLTYDGKIKFACVDGPDFDGHKVDFDEAIYRNNIYKDFERKRKEDCNLLK